MTVSTQRFLTYLNERNFGPYIGVPCSFLKPFINYVIESEEVEYIAANNEGEAVALASGAYLAGKKPVVMFQNSGLGNAINPLTSLNYIFRIPLLLISTLRGEPGLKDEPQHLLMGEATGDFFDVARVKHGFFPEADDDIESSMEEAIAFMDGEQLPYAFIMRKDGASAYELGEGDTSYPPGPSGKVLEGERVTSDLILRRDAVVSIADVAGPAGVLVATTGKTARELFEERDAGSNFYVIGSMGCASSVALGIALYKPDRKVVVLDGDGAALMRLEAMVSIGHAAAPNLVHVVLDNGVHESTGGQATLARSVRFPELAVACGYETAVSISSDEALKRHLARASDSKGPHLIHLRIRPGSDPSLGRPTLTPVEMKNRFMKTLQAS